MGFFSWKTLDGQKSISNIYSEYGALPVVMLVPKKFGGAPIIERNYDGYGHFNGFDAYQLLCKWNRPELYTGDTETDRSVGIDIGCYEEDMAKLEFPLKFVSLDYYKKTKCTYEDFDDFSKGCPNQGYFYD